MLSCCVVSCCVLVGAGIFGLTGVDQLLCFMIVSELSSFVRVFRKVVTKPVSDFLSKLSSELHPTSAFPAHALQLYDLSAGKVSKVVGGFLSLVSSIGQMQLIRRQVANELNFSAKLDSNILTAALDTINQALTNDVRAHYAHPNDKPYPGNPTLPDIADYLETAGETTSPAHLQRPVCFVSHPSSVSLLWQVFSSFCGPTPLTCRFLDPT